MATFNEAQLEQAFVELFKGEGYDYRRIVIVDGNRRSWIDDGITYIGVIPFLLDNTILN